MGMQRAQNKIRNSGTYDEDTTTGALIRICDRLSIDDVESFENK